MERKLKLTAAFCCRLALLCLLGAGTVSIPAHASLRELPTRKGAKTVPAGPPASLAYGPQAVKGPLRVSANGRYLTYTDGSPFFYLGDTGWMIFKRLYRSEVDLYMADRAAKGFTVIMAPIMPWQARGVTEPNVYGHTPLLNNDPTRPNESYFQHVDYVINKAESLGMYFGLLPAWGDKVNGYTSADLEIFTTETARRYGAWLANRYRYKPIIWILGGDQIPEESKHYAIFRAMAEGIRSVVGTSQLITYHPKGKTTSSTYFHGDTWLNFNMFQSGHYAFNQTSSATITQADYRRYPAKPVINGEACYEDHPVNWNAANGWFNDYDVRQSAYWSVFSGAFGYVYGNNNIFQFYDPTRGNKLENTPRTPWKTALGHPGAGQMRHLRLLMEARRLLSIVPDQGIIAAGQGTGADYLTACRGGDFSFVYASTGQQFTVNLGKVTGTAVNGWWFDPRTGKSTFIGKFTNSGTRSFDPPGSKARGNDWILVLDDASKNYAGPGGTAPPTLVVTSTIRREVWTGVSGTSITSIPLTRTPSFTSQPTLFESPANYGDNYATRLRGYVHPPVTGYYTFWIAGDDNTELWLSTSDSPTGKVRIARSGWTYWRQWTKYASQKSVAIRLEAGKKYYVEALHKEGTGGGDGVSVGWQLPGGALERPIPGNRLSPFVPGAAREAAQEEPVEAAAETVRLFPNPANDYVTLAFTAREGGPTDVVVHDALAREVKRLRVQVAPGANTVRIPVPDLSPGLYFLQWGNEPARKLVIER
jgi:hypothetical protein